MKALCEEDGDLAMAWRKCEELWSMEMEPCLWLLVLEGLEVVSSKGISERESH